MTSTPQQPNTISRPPARAAYPALLAATVAATLLLKALALQSFILGSIGYDFFCQWFAYRMFFRSQYVNGLFPLWSHNLLGGYPLAAFPHASAFYPLNLFFYLGNYQWGSTLFFIFHLGLGGYFLYGLARHFRASAMAAGFAAVAFTMSGAMFWNLVNNQDFLTALWLTGFFWAGFALLRRPRLPVFLALAAVTAAMILSGSLELIVFGVATFAAVAVAAGPNRRVLPAAGAALLLGAGLALVQVGLTVAFLPHSYRHFHGSDYLALRGYSHLENVIHMLLQRPPLPGNKYDFSFYGFIPLLGLALLPSDREGRRRRLAVLVLAVLYLPGAIDMPAFSALLRLVPFWGSFSAPDMQYRMFATVIGLGFAVSAGGIDQMSDGLDRNNLRRLRLFLLYYLSMQVFFLAWDLRDNPFGPTHASRLVVIGLLAFLLFRSLKARGPFTLGPAFLFAVILFDVALPPLAGQRTEDPTVYQQKEFFQASGSEVSTERIHFLSPRRNDRELWRLFRIDRGPGSMVGNIRNGINEYHCLIREMHPQDLELFLPDVVAPRNQALLDYLGVRTLIAHGARPPSSSPYRLVTTRKNLAFYTNQEAMPRFSLFGRTRVLPPDQAREAWFAPGFDPRRELLLSDPAAAALEGASPGPIGRAEVNTFQQGRMTLTTDAPAESWLSNAEPYYPGWKVWVDGKEARLVRADYAFQGLRLPAGRHRVEFRFLPREFKIGLWATLATAALALAVAAIHGTRRGARFGDCD